MSREEKNKERYRSLVSSGICIYCKHRKAEKPRRTCKKCYLVKRKYDEKRKHKFYKVQVIRSDE